MKLALRYGLLVTLLAVSSSQAGQALTPAPDKGCVWAWLIEFGTDCVALAHAKRVEQGLSKLQKSCPQAFDVFVRFCKDMDVQASALTAALPLLKECKLVNADGTIDSIVKYVVNHIVQPANGANKNVVLS